MATADTKLPELIAELDQLRSTGDLAAASATARELLHLAALSSDSSARAAMALARRHATEIMDLAVAAGLPPEDLAYIRRNVAATQNFRPRKPSCEPSPPGPG